MSFYRFFEFFPLSLICICGVLHPPLSYPGPWYICAHCVGRLGRAGGAMASVGKGPGWLEGESQYIWARLGYVCATFAAVPQNDKPPLKG